MAGYQSQSPAEETIVRTLGEASPLFYLTLIVGMLCLPVGLAFMTGFPMSSWLGISGTSIGIGALVISLQLAPLKVLIRRHAIVCRRRWQKNEIAWQDVQSLRFATHRGRTGSPVAGMIFVESPHRTFHFTVRPSAFLEIKERLSQICTRAAIVDDDTATIQPPKAGDGDWRRSQTRKYARRLVIARVGSSGMACVVVAIYGAIAVRRCQSSIEAGIILIVCAIIIGGCVAHVYGLIKRLWH